MLTPHARCASLPSSERLKLLRFAASFVWADLDLADSERAFLRDLADELDVNGTEARALLDGPPAAEDVDPCRVSPALAGRVRDVALRAIAADGKVQPKEMRMFDLLDELLPRGRVRASPRRRRARAHPA